MNVDMWEAILWGAVGGAAWTIPAWVRSTLRDRRRRRERAEECLRRDRLILREKAGDLPSGALTPPDEKGGR